MNLNDTPATVAQAWLQYAEYTHVNQLEPAAYDAMQCAFYAAWAVFFVMFEKARDEARTQGGTDTLVDRLKVWEAEARQYAMDVVADQAPGESRH